MNTDTPSTQNTTSTSPVTGASSTTTPAPANAVTAPETISKDEHVKMLEKVRKEEKEKLYPEMYKLKGEREANEQELAKAKAETADLKAKLLDKENSSLTETQKLERRLSDLESKTQKIESEKSEIQANANLRVAELELKLHRNEKIRTAGIEFPELVTGSTPEEIDASIEAARTREAEVMEKVKGRLREEVAKELGAQLPNSGRSPTDDSAGKDGASVLTLAQRVELAAEKDPVKYRAARARILAEAHSKVPATHPLKLARAGA